MSIHYRVSRQTIQKLSATMITMHVAACEAGPFVQTVTSFGYVLKQDVASKSACTGTGMQHLVCAVYIMINALFSLSYSCLDLKPCPYSPGMFKM